MATGFTDWFAPTHTVTITYDPTASGAAQYQVDYDGIGSYVGTLQDMPTGLRNVVYPFDGINHFLQGDTGYHADYQRDFHIGDGSPEDPDTLSPYIPSDPGSGASDCAWQWARHSLNHSDFWENTCPTDYAVTSPNPLEPGTTVGPLDTAIAYYGNVYNPFIAQFGDVGWDWSTCVLALQFGTLWAAGEALISELAPATAMTLEWDETEPAVTFLAGSWSFTQSGDYPLRAFKRRRAYHGTGTPPGPLNETGAPWWPGMDGVAPVGGTEFPSGSSFSADDLTLLSNGSTEVWEYVNAVDSDLIVDELHFAFVPDWIVDDDFPSIDGVTTYGKTASVDTVTFTFMYQTRPFRWEYRLPPEQGPGDIRRRFKVGKQ